MNLERKPGESLASYFERITPEQRLASLVAYATRERSALKFL